MLTYLGRQQAVPDGIRITAVFKDGQVSGSAGIGATMMACPESVMKAGICMVEKVKEFTFLLERPALTYQEGDLHDLLLLAPSP
jgi:hypothetical protein